MEKDLVCGMEVDEKKAGERYNYKGKTYYFCASECKDRFVKSPEQYIGK